MTKRNLLFLFVCAGLIFALIAGVYVYRLNRPPGPEEAQELLRTFIGRIAGGDLAGARELMTPETAQLLRDPGTALGRTVYRNLTLVSAENILPSGENGLSADVVLSAPDTLAIMAKAGQLFAEQVTENGPAEDPDAAVAEIYDELLARDDLPLLPQFLIVRMVRNGGSLRIVGDAALQSAVEGGSTDAMNGISTVLGSE